MSTEIPVIYARFVHAVKGVVRQGPIFFVPRAGDELRFAENEIYMAVGLTWRFDTSTKRIARLDIEIERVA